MKITTAIRAIPSHSVRIRNLLCAWYQISTLPNKVLDYLLVYLLTFFSSNLDKKVPRYYITRIPRRKPMR